VERLSAKLRNRGIDFDITRAANPTVKCVANHWMSSKLAVHTDLMGAPCIKTAFPKRTWPKRLTHDHFCDSFTANTLR
jgi:hypothetical protein